MNNNLIRRFLEEQQYDVRVSGMVDGLIRNVHLMRFAL